ncbi:MAG: hypothetical protein HUK20_11080 [Fibrobacter sp.]|nr:hypothetical protein [Fibrobacter sp.]
MTDTDKQEIYSYLKANLERLEKCLDEDEAGAASTMLHHWRQRLDELTGARVVAHEMLLLEDYARESLKDLEGRIKAKIQGRLESRIEWLARGLDRSIEAAKARGETGRFTTAVILSNAYNDILQTADYKRFTGGNET